MTAAVNDLDALCRVLASTSTLFLDFDGPICDVFAGIPAHIVARQLSDILTEDCSVAIPPEVQEATDPFEVLHHATMIGERESRLVGVAFTAHEVEAVESAKSTPGAHEVIRTWKSTGRSLAVVSNNSKKAVETYLSLHYLDGLVDYVSARQWNETSRLKPSPYLLLQAAANLNVRPEECAFVGDSVSDIRAASAANVTAIAYANKPKKEGVMLYENPQVVITTMKILEKAAQIRRAADPPPTPGRKTLT